MTTDPKTPHTIARFVATTILAATLAVTVTACRSRPGEKLRSGGLYERVEREDGLHKVAAKVTAAVKADASMAEKLATVDMAQFEKRLAEFLCQAAGGPCKYPGKLADVWQGVTLDEEGFEALMEVVITGMTDAELPQKEQNDLIDLLMKAHQADA
jgi:hemoglobin